MKSFSKTAQESASYNDANIASKKCFGRNVDPCENRFKPRPIECSRKVYNQAGLNPKGKLQPDNVNSWPNGWVGESWKKGQDGVGVLVSFYVLYYGINVKILEIVLILRQILIDTCITICL